MDILGWAMTVTANNKVWLNYIQKKIMDLLVLV
jgi:hypothetical protein